MRSLIHPRQAGRFAQLLMLLGALALAACGGGDDQPSAEEIQSLGQFCEHAVALDDLAVATGASSAPGVYDGETPTFVNLLEQFVPGADNMAESAPADVSGAVTTLLEGIRARAAGDMTAITTTDFGEAVKAVADFRAANCQVGGATSGDG